MIKHYSARLRATRRRRSDSPHRPHRRVGERHLGNRGAEGRPRGYVRLLPLNWRTRTDSPTSTVHDRTCGKLLVVS